jgi:hypothetical protein
MGIKYSKSMEHLPKQLQNEEYIIMHGSDGKDYYIQRRSYKQTFKNNIITSFQNSFLNSGNNTFLSDINEIRRAGKDSFYYITLGSLTGPVEFTPSQNNYNNVKFFIYEFFRINNFIGKNNINLDNCTFEVKTKTPEEHTKTKNQFGFGKRKTNSKLKSLIMDLKKLKSIKC